MRWLLRHAGALVPLVTVLLFLIIMLGAYWLLRGDERAREEQFLLQESQFLSQRLSEQLLSRQDDVQRLVHTLLLAPHKEEAFDQAARTLMARDPSLFSLTWLDAGQQVIDSHRSPGLPERARHPLKLPGKEAVPQEALRERWSVTPAIAYPHGAAQPSLLRLLVPIRLDSVFTGTVVAEYSPQLLLNSVLRGEHVPYLAVALLGQSDESIAGVSVPHAPPSSPFSSLSGEVFEPPHLLLPITPLGEQLRLGTAVYRSNRDVSSQALLGLLVLLGLLTSVMLLLNWRLSRRQLQAQRRLREESSFRRAIENALLTGIRVLDMNGTTTYTNAAFSRMVGWTQEEMVGMKIPFPYWPHKDREILTQRFRAEISGRHYPSGLQLRMQRKSGSIFDARVFVSPLLNESGTQTGWLTTINDITEPNRIRQQLAAAHERFTVVLESLDASISVAPLGSRELVFANRLYRQWFGADSSGHLQMLARAGVHSAQEAEDSPEEEDAFMGLPTEVITSANSDHSEIFIESLGKWLEVRSRYLDWVDGRLAQMLIATDISKRKQAEEQAARHIQKMESVSRLMTMGEMASSVAHELNQPLAAISNYTNGMISRIKAESISLEQLLQPLEKTAHQAVRAGQVVHRIRSFVRRSEFNRDVCTPARLVSEALELANIELRKHSVTLTIHVEPQLPTLHVDPILTEQVLINLLKNAAEAIDAAGMPAERRHVQLKVSSKDQGVYFQVIDRGPGFPEVTATQLFEAFYSTKKEGMGIGLNLCRSIIESHQGKMQVHNLYNSGVTTGCEFSFWLPATVHSAASRPDSDIPILG